MEKFCLASLFCTVGHSHTSSKAWNIVSTGPYCQCDSAITWCYWNTAQHYSGTLCARQCRDSLR
jgi:hypothetical protein